MKTNHINPNTPYRQCAISVMDTIADPDITFDGNGISNYYYEYKEAEKRLPKSEAEGWKKLEALAEKIKQAGKNKPYDCIIGLSGGVDSSYVAILAKKLGLRPLAVHFDNGWNSELSVKNIENVVNKLNFDLHTLVIDWEEFLDLQLSYFKASVVDLEVPTDHAISGTIAQLCKKHGIKYSLSGNNIVTEFTMPPSWIFNKNDNVNLQAIHKKYGTRPLNTYPLFSTYLKRYLNNIIQAESLQIVNYVPFNKSEIKQKLIKDLGWKDYGGKHYESIFTKFYQAYILPHKFKIDKRKAHLSTLIFSGQITKQEALVELEQPLYEKREFEKEFEYILKKMEITKSEFETFMSTPRVEHSSFPTEKSIYDKFAILKPLRKLKGKIIRR